MILVTLTVTWGSVRHTTKDQRTNKTEQALQSFVSPAKDERKSKGQTLLPLKTALRWNEAPIGKNVRDSPEGCPRLAQLLSKKHPEKCEAGYKNSSNVAWGGP